MRLGLFLGVGMQQGSSGITGSPPILDPITVGDTLADVVTTGSANPPSGETFTGASPINEQNIDGAGWVAYVSSTAPTLGQTVQVRQRWETLEGSTRTFTSVERTVQASLATFDSTNITFDSTNRTFDEAA